MDNIHVTNQLTNQQIKWSSVLLEKQKAAQQLKNFPTFYET
jgi:hypothetical protein